MNHKESILTILALFFVMATNAMANDHVVTLYFGGTQCKNQNYNPSETAWKNHHELLASLYNYQINDERYQTTYFIDGIGSANFCWTKAESDAQAATPWINGCRGWDQVQEEAIDKLKEVLENPSINSVIINLVGFSRGGASALAFADRLGSPKDIGDLNNQHDDNARKNPLFPEYEYKISKLNILVFEPVAGDRLDWKQRWRDFSLPKKVSNFVGIYAADERSWPFAPLQPAFHSAETNAWSVMVRGSHETLVGNKQFKGHSLFYDAIFSDDETAEDLENIYKISEIIAIELLGTSDWGRVQFHAPTGAAADGRWSWFEERLSLGFNERKGRFSKYIKGMDAYPEKSSEHPHSWEAMRQATFFGFSEWCGEKYRCVIEYPEAAQWGIVNGSWPFADYGFVHTVASLDGINIPLLTESLSRPDTFPNAQLIDGHQVWHKIHPFEVWITTEELVTSCETGEAEVFLAATTTPDEFDRTLTFEWSLRDENTFFATGQTTVAALPEGNHEITLTVYANGIEVGKYDSTVTVAPPIIGDLDCDSCVSRTDYNEIINVVRARLPYNPVYDLNNDGAVNIGDARYLTTRFSVPRGAPCQ